MYVTPFFFPQQLPEMIPVYWDMAIMNRAFKRRVIQLVIARLPRLVDLAPGEQLIIDYMGPPMLYTDRDSAPSPLTDLEPLGEVFFFHVRCCVASLTRLCGQADLKFFRYAEVTDAGRCDGGGQRLTLLSAAVRQPACDGDGQRLPADCAAPAAHAVPGVPGA